MKKALLLLGILALTTGCSNTEPTPLTKDICEKCYSKPISLTDSKKVHKKWGDRELKNDESTNSNISCGSFSKVYLKEKCESLK